jgi:tRNA (cytosine34-C5)-methyltransferase
MGKRGRGGRKRDRSDGKQEGSWINMADASTFQSEKFEKYYRGTIIPEGDWEAVIKSFASPLPTCIRFNLALPSAVRQNARQALAQQFSECGIVQQVHDFMPESSAFQIPVSRGVLKRHASNRKAKVLTAAWSDLGYLSRQEAVSMIPVLFLDVQPGNTVIDMCSAPGSKTAQILELLVRGEEQSAAHGNFNAGGCVVANDVNAGRLDILNHQTGRAPRAQERLLITKQDATRFPIPHGEKIFDRVLCDVMCSGDGTLRKSIDLWQRWTAADGPALHQSQLQVLLRGMQLCKPGGIVVYSTCSLNPIEDEAVVMQALREGKGAFRLINTLDMFPALKRYQGQTKWQVTNKEATVVFQSPEEANASGAKFKRYSKSMWPPTEEEAAEAHLEYCLRLPPHLQDTGGFFVAALRCESEYGSTGKPHPKHEESKPNPTGRIGTMSPISSELTVRLRTLLNLPEESSFPFHRLFSRGEGNRLPKLYYVNDDSIKVMQKLGYMDLQQAGQKVLECAVKHDPNSWRFCSEGISTLRRYLPPTSIWKLQSSALQSLITVADGRLLFSTFHSWLTEEDKAVHQGVESPPGNFCCVCDLGEAGEFHFVGTALPVLGAGMPQWVKIRITDPQLVLIKYHFGLPIVPENDNQAEDGADGSSSESDAAEDDAAGDAQPVAGQADPQ